MRDVQIQAGIEPLAGIGRNTLVRDLFTKLDEGESPDDVPRSWTEMYEEDTFVLVRALQTWINTLVDRKLVSRGFIQKGGRTSAEKD
jgi:hypothetical protein